MKTRTTISKLGVILATPILAVLTLALIMLLMAQGASATGRVGQTPGGWVMVAGFTGTISIVDTATDIVYGPILSGELGTSGGGLLDVALTPDGNTALLSNFGDQAIYFVDVSNPISPAVISSVTIPFAAEDIAITHDGRQALVTDGSYSSLVASIDLISRTLAYTVDLAPLQAQAVETARDNTVVVADYFNGQIHSLYPDASGQLTVTGSYSYALMPDGSLADSLVATATLAQPANLGISPDGKTVIVGSSLAYNAPTYTLYAVGVYQIASPGILSFTGVITGLERAVQSVAFSPAGDRAYLAANGGNPDDMEYDRLLVLDINGPGMASLNLDRSAELLRMTQNHLFGVDTIAIANNKAYLGYPNVGGAANDLQLVDLATMDVMTVTMPGIPAGVAVIPPKRIFVPLVLNSAP